MGVQLAPALPECVSCDRPMPRKAHEAQGGLCNACGVNSPAAHAHAAGRALGTPHDAR